MNLVQPRSCYANRIEWGKWALPSYRLYRLDGAGRISTAEWIEASDDDGARLMARTQLPCGKYELWDRGRLVERPPGST